MVSRTKDSEHRVGYAMLCIRANDVRWLKPKPSVCCRFGLVSPWPSCMISSAGANQRYINSCEQHQQQERAALVLVCAPILIIVIVIPFFVASTSTSASAARAAVALHTLLLLLFLVSTSAAATARCSCGGTVVRISFGAPAHSRLSTVDVFGFVEISLLCLRAYCA